MNGSQIAAITFARELHCLYRAGAMLKIMSRWQDLKILIFYYKSILQKLGRMLKPFELKFCSDLSVRFKDIAEKQVPAN